MSLLIESQVRARAKKDTGLYTSTANVLNEHLKKQADVTQYDIFLSHAYDDRELILGVALSIEDIGYSVYIDWRDDPLLDRKNVTPATAEKLRERMRISRCLFYSTTQQASESMWMPWELGYKDGHNARVAILPVSSSATDSFAGQQYLGLYPYVSDEKDTDGKRTLWINRTPKIYVSFKHWMKGEEPSDHSK